WSADRRRPAGGTVDGGTGIGLVDSVTVVVTVEAVPERAATVPERAAVPEGAAVVGACAPSVRPGAGAVSATLAAARAGAGAAASASTSATHATTGAGWVSFTPMRA